ncbi:MAG: hypothetical protein JXB04_03490 [Kiritimatiellae bacterium]|nr:hypothetical protein [Kiritimatiellia bacterium]
MAGKQGGKNPERDDAAIGEPTPVEMRNVLLAAREVVAVATEQEQWAAARQYCPASSPFEGPMVWALFQMQDALQAMRLWERDREAPPPLPLPVSFDALAAAFRSCPLETRYGWDMGGLHGSAGTIVSFAAWIGMMNDAVKRVARFVPADIRGSVEEEMSANVGAAAGRGKRGRGQRLSEDEKQMKLAKALLLIPALAKEGKLSRTELARRVQVDRRTLASWPEIARAFQAEVAERASGVYDARTEAYDATFDTDEIPARRRQRPARDRDED